TDACVNCQIAFCGDGFVEQGVEQCDDGNASNSDGCVAGCVLAQCGDGFLHLGVEECDDGNLIDGDGCSSMCKLPFCGAGVVEPGEQCDLGAANADRPALQRMQSGIKQAVMPVDKPMAAPFFYNYFSASGHTGYEAVGASHVWLYRDTTTGGLSLFMEHGIDFDTSGQFQPNANVHFDIQNL